jgi:predicted secreted Zn-dependent protease
MVEAQRSFAMKRLTQRLVLAALIAAIGLPAHAASVVKSYSYFNIGGRTLEELEGELNKRGPQMKNTGRRHPGATQMEFTSRVGYAEQGGKCSVAKATVTVKAKVILPRWRAPRRADQDTRLIWNTLSADIKRHEESHVIIAKNHARELEESLRELGRFNTCQAAQSRVKQVTDRILAKHDREQTRFDRIEGINFESRILRLLQYRMERM